MSTESLTSSSGAWLRTMLRAAWGRDSGEGREFLVETYLAVGRGEPELGYLGRTWITRGSGYWARRIAVTFLYLVLAVFLGTLFLGLGPDLLFNKRYGFNAHLPAALKIAVLVVWYAPACVAYLGMYRRLVLHGFSSGRLRQGLPTGFLSGRLLLPLLIPFLSIPGGLVVAMFTATLRADFPGESAAREARDRYQEQQSAHEAARRKGRRRSGRG